MGSYTFRWEHPADTVFVTGTFDDWNGSTHKLDKTGNAHEKTITLPPTHEKILYKFVADGIWSHDHTAKTETDNTGNVNNVLYAHDIMPATINSVGQGSTTNDLAGAQPLEKEASHLPGAFPETPAALESSKEPTYGVNPIPASAGASNPVKLEAGEKVPEPSTINSNTISSGVHDDPELMGKATSPEQAFGIAPIPATGGMGNPIHLEPGEAVPPPQTLTGHTLTSNVKLDKDSYEKSDASAPVLSASHPHMAKDDKTLDALGGVGPQTSSLIPESSIGMGNDVPATLDSAPNVGPTLSSVGANSTTNELAGQQPKELRREAQVIGDSPAPNSSKNEGGIYGAVAGGLATAGAAAAGTAAYLHEKTKQTTGTDPYSHLPESVQASINKMNSGSPTSSQAPTSTGTTAPVPAEVSASQKQADVDPEASSSPAAVLGKSDMENELLSKVPTTQATGESAPIAGAATAVPSEVTASQEKAHVGPDASANPEAVHEKSDVEKELLSKVPTSSAVGESAPSAGAAAAVPSEVAASQKEAHKDPEASSNPVAVHEKSDVEKELLSKVHTSDAAGEPAPTATAATSETAPSIPAASAATAAGTAGALGAIGSSATKLSDIPSTTPAAPSTTSALPAEHVGVPPAISAHGAPQLGAVGHLAPINLDDKPAGLSTGTTSGLNASADSPAQIAATKASRAQESRDVSPMTTPGGAGQTQPVVTTGVDSAKVPATSSSTPTPRKNVGRNSSSAKRASFIDRLKGTPESSKGSSTGAAPDAGSGSSDKKKKGLFSRIKEKIQNH